MTAFSDGRAWVVWEDGGRVLPAQATFDETVRSLEVRAALYDPVVGRFTRTDRLTTNAVHDGSPRLSGPSADDLVAVWISTSGSELLGSASQPNTVYAAWWNGSRWTGPEVVAEVAQPILRAELLYSGSDAYVVLSVDTDGNTGTVSDQEIALLRHTGGAWQPLRMLTTNSVVDGNPKLVRTPAGQMLLAWVQGDALIVDSDLDAPGPGYTWTNLYSTGFADFRLAQNDAGRLAIVWAQPSGYSSDLWALFYDPATATWGARRRSRPMPPRKGSTASACSARP